MKLIFLDIDGVLNNELWFKSPESRVQTEDKEEYSKKRFFDPRCVELLNILTESTGAKIVISSSWRTRWQTIEEMQEFLEDVGITGDIIDRTPKLYFRGLEDYNYSVPRGCEIKAWLETHKDILGKKISQVNYVILDDDSDMLYWQRRNFIWIDPYSGLTPNIIHKAKYILTQNYD